RALTRLGLWLLHTCLALPLLPLTHPGRLQARVGRRPSRRRTAATVAIALLPLVLGAASVAGRLDLGNDLPWQVALAIGDWGIGVPIAIAGCALAGSLAALFVVAGTGTAAEPTERVTQRWQRSAHCAAAKDG